jgi:hypothetical protein
MTAGFSWIRSELWPLERAKLRKILDAAHKGHSDKCRVTKIAFNFELSYQ